jgi:hypothetical protein
MCPPSNELVIPASRLKLAGILLGALAFVALGALMIYLEFREDWFAVFIGFACVAFFGAVAVSVTHKMVSAGPAVIINSRGITDNSSGVSVGFVAWDDIAEVRAYTFQNQTFLGIVPKDLDKVLATLPGWKRKAIRANLALGAAPMNIPQIVLGVKVSDLVREIETRFRPRR